MPDRGIHGGDIYQNTCRLDFSANLNPLGMPPAVEQAAVEAIKSASCYPDPRCTALREAIAGKEGIPAKQIVCGNGAAELIYMICYTLRPERALLAAPSFAEYEMALTQCGSRISWYDLKEENGFVLQSDYLQQLTDETDILFLCNPNNPTGIPVPEELMSRILEECTRKKITAVMDECFAGILSMPPETKETDAENGKDTADNSDDIGKADTKTAGNHNRVKSAGDYLKGYDGQLIVLDAFTKRYAMAGLRLGYALCSSPQLADRIRQAAQPWNVSVAAQAAGTAALRQEEYVRCSAAVMAQEKDWLRHQLLQLGLPCDESAANFLLFRGPENLGESLLKQGILIRDCSNYRGLQKGYWRIAVRTREENEQLMEAVRKSLAQQLQKEKRGE